MSRSWNGVPSILWDSRGFRDGRRAEAQPDDEIKRFVVLCSGKVYYDLLEAREAQGPQGVYLLRIEQLYPFPARALITNSRGSRGRK